MITFLAEKEYLTPPDNEAIPVTKCCACCETIYAGEEYYRLDGFNFCEDCMYNNFKVIAEPPDLEAEKANLEHDDEEVN